MGRTAAVAALHQRFPADTKAAETPSEDDTMTYTVSRTASPIGLNGDWEAPAWATADTADIAVFRPESSEHRPRTQVRLLYDDTALHGIFRVEDQYVRCVHEGFQQPVCRDSCVEFFFKPDIGRGYMNLELSCGGSFLCYHVHDWRRIGDEGLAGFTPLSADLGQTIGVWHSLPRRIEPELSEPTTWVLQFRLPLTVVEAFTGDLGPLQGRRWSGNFYKCGDQTSHPHWASWAPVRALNFHLPECFDELLFA